MPISYHPKPGQLMLCDFSQGFKEPEMIKSSRPVIILSGNIVGRASLVTVVACSTVEPDVG
ncbi:type II toxin-antitoxin system PemK/MazF family toxin [Enterobacter roggenkampii]|uniref:type II toxin-antitoxin system PemK/MazF family toxin n=1 Tax=Enterobacter roggenkampii TaxID=1812935 RepID=UPI0015EA22F0|nr:type II toxin-antitoxin system PemK/MazF family toxin [Enterobacter roggenkampii]